MIVFLEFMEHFINTDHAFNSNARVQALHKKWNRFAP